MVGEGKEIEREDFRKAKKEKTLALRANWVSALVFSLDFLHTVLCIVK